MRWYISVAAVREYMPMAGYDPRDDGDQFRLAERELADVCNEARLSKSEPGREIYRVNVTLRGYRKRLELTVALSDRAEGDKAQLVRVRDKGRSDRRE